MRQELHLMFTSTIRMGKKCDVWFWPWHDCWCWTGWFKCVCTADLLGFPHTTVSRVYSEWCEKQKKHPVISSSVDGNILLMREVNREWADWYRADRKATVTEITTLLTTLWWAEKASQNAQHIKLLRQMRVQADRPHQVWLQFSQEQKSEAAVDTGSPKLDNWKTGTM